jgi:capsular exopolysaccharide synthesis family protein
MAELLFDRETSQSQQGFTLDFKRVLARAIRFWYVVVLALGVALVIAFYKNRYTERIYPVTASIIIRETQEISGAEFLYKNALIDQYRNYLNEPYILRSYPVMEKVVRNKNFHVSFYREGYFMTTEAYDYIPVKVSWCEPAGVTSGRFLFILTDTASYSIKPYSGKEDKEIGSVYPLNDSVQYKGYNLCISRIPGRSVRAYVGIPFLLVIGDPKAVAGAYINRLKVSWAEQGAGVINLSITGPNRLKEIDFLNELITVYQENDLEKKNETASRTIAFIQNQLREIKDSLKVVEFQLERFGGSGRMKDMSTRAQQLFTRLEALEVQKSELIIRQNYFDYLDTYLKRGEGSYDQIILPASMGINDPVLNALLSQLIELQGEVKVYAGPERMKNPLLQSKINRLTELRKELEEAVRSLKASDKIRRDFVEQQIKTNENQLGMLPTSERQLIAVQRNYSLLENLYIYLMQRLSEAGISKAANTSDIIPVNPPMAGGAIVPKPTQNYIVALVLGLAIPFFMFILFEAINNRVQSKEDINKLTTIPFIGGVGHSLHPNNLIVKEKPKSGVSESFRAMRSNLNYFTGNKNRQVFMVTSSISGEGKTFTTINLATVFALSGKRTLIVGADMRRPKLFADFDCRNDVGLSTYLSHINEFDQVVQPTTIENLYLVSGGPVPPNPSELLLTDRFELFIKEALENFDFVIIDTPPLALVTDAFVISKFADHTVFVLRQNFSPKQFIRSIDEYYRSGKIKNISILLNDIYKSGLGYGYGQGYAYQYGYSYGYGRKKNGGYYSE